MNKQTVLVVDDDPDIVRLVKGYLTQAGYDVLTAGDGKTAVSLLHRHEPDLLVLDLMLPDGDGWDITRQVRNDARLAKLPIIMVTARVDDTDKIVGLELGADDYVTKPFNPRELVARVRAQLRRTGWDSEPEASILKSGQVVMDMARREVMVNGRLVELTPTEYDLLKTLLENPGFVFTREDLIEKALGYSYEGIGRTLDSHIKNLRRKIEPDPKKPTYVQTVYGVGYRLAEG